MPPFGERDQDASRAAERFQDREARISFITYQRVRGRG
jgi:hypothetical protein